MRRDPSSTSTDDLRMHMLHATKASIAGVDDTIYVFRRHLPRIGILYKRRKKVKQEDGETREEFCGRGQKPEYALLYIL